MANIKTLSNGDKRQILKIQDVLSSIDNGNPKFFNTTQYERLGFVKTRKKFGINAIGNKVQIGHSFNLTAKGRKYLNFII